MLNVSRGTVYMCNLGKKEGHIQGGFRPVLVISNQLANRFSPVILVVPISSRKPKHNLPTHVEIDKIDFETGAVKTLSVAHCEQIQSINRNEIHSRIGKLNEIKIRQIEEALMLQLSIKI